MIVYGISLHGIERVDVKREVFHPTDGRDPYNVTRYVFTDEDKDTFEVTVFSKEGVLVVDNTKGSAR